MLSHYQPYLPCYCTTHEQESVRKGAALMHLSSSPISRTLDVIGLLTYTFQVCFQNMFCLIYYIKFFHFLNNCLALLRGYLDVL